MFGKDLYKWVCTFAGDMYPGPDGDLEPEWVKNEKEQFSQYRDKDGDGFMDKEEVSWCRKVELVISNATESKSFAVNLMNINLG